MQKLTKPSIFNELQTPMLSLARSLAGNNCSGKMDSFGSDKVLISDAQNITDIVRTDIDSHVNEYCKARVEGNIKFVDCLVDFKEFSSNYISHCGELGGNFFPVSLLMQCSRSGESDNLELEMELINIPSCFVGSCTLEESYEALAGILDSSEQSISAIRSSEECHIYHDYDYLSKAPKFTEAKLSYVEDYDSSISSGTLKSIFPGVVMLSMVATLGLQVVLELN
jgi:hypothetical protein